MKQNIDSASGYSTKEFRMIVCIGMLLSKPVLLTYIIEFKEQHYEKVFGYCLYACSA